MRGSPSSLLFLNISQGSLRATSWVSLNKLPQPKQYATESSQSNTNRKTPWTHIILLGLSSWLSKRIVQPQPKPHTTQSSDGGTKRWVHYAALGLWRDASQDEIKRKYYELSKKHHPDVSQDPSSLETFRKVTEAYAVLGKKKTRRKYDQYEQLYSALMTGLKDQDKSMGDFSSSSPRPVDPTYWDPVKLGSSTFYRPPPGYWTAMNKITRDREKSNALIQKDLSSATPSRERTEGNGTRDRRNEPGVDIPGIVAFGLVFAFLWEGQEWLLRCLRGFLMRVQEDHESGSSEDHASQAIDPYPDG